MSWQDARDCIIAKMENDGRFEYFDPNDQTTKTIDKQPTKDAMGWIAQCVLDEVRIEFFQTGVQPITYSTAGPDPLIFDETIDYNSPIASVDAASPDFVSIDEPGTYNVRLNVCFEGGGNQNNNGVEVVLEQDNTIVPLSRSKQGWIYSEGVQLSTECFVEVSSPPSLLAGSVERLGNTTQDIQITPNSSSMTITEVPQ